MKRFPTLLILLSMVACLQAQKTRIRDCDLFFHVTLNSNPITEATSVNGVLIDHVGIFYWLDGKPVIIEATYRGVAVTPIEGSEWVEHAQQIYVGRIRGKIDKEQSIANALSYVGKPYDFLYQEGDDEIYCSELVQLSFVDKHNRPIFQTVPMSFHDISGQILPYWEDYYSRRGMTVPEGEPGTNPNEMAHRKNVKVFKLIPKAPKRLQRKMIKPCGLLKLLKKENDDNETNSFVGHK